MKNNVKIIANYLPQYHAIPENDEWWGEGFTDWVTVKKARSLYSGHQQPKIPAENHYYSLDDVEELKWQTKLANEYGVYGFGIYHYWFSSSLHLLGKPSEIILKHKELDINYFFLWDNCTWKRTWSNVKHANDWAPTCDDGKESEDKKGILAELIYGSEEDWKAHFMYLLPFFKDKRYIKVDNCPLFGFFQPNNEFSTICRMAQYWNKLARVHGFAGVRCMTRDNYMKQNLEYKFRYTPLVPNDKISYLRYKSKDIIAKKRGKIRFYDYDKCWREILKEAKRSDEKTLLSGFVRFDDTPRRGKKGRVILGDSADKFEKYMSELITISQRQNKEFIFLTAWNEWGEGAYLEPDSMTNLSYLESLKKAIEITNWD